MFKKLHLLLFVLIFLTGCSLKAVSLDSIESWENVLAVDLEEEFVDFDLLTWSLPELYISIETEITDKKTKHDAKFNLYYNIDSNQKKILSMKWTISGRWNSTREMPKKPYKIKLNEETSLLWLAAKKDRILLANYADKSLIRNYLVDRLGKKMDAPFIPSARFIELYINGKYQWNYLLTDREVAINTLKDGEEDPIAITSGRVMEIDQRVLRPWVNEPHIVSSKFPIKINSPKNPSKKQLEYIKQYIKKAEDALFWDYFQDPHEWFRQYWDEESMIKRFLISELVKNVDSINFSSIWFFKDDSWLLKMWPLRDFDYAIANNIEPRITDIPDWRFVHDNAWFCRMYQDPKFKKHTREIRDEYKDTILQLIPLIDDLALYLDSSQKRNFEIRDINDSNANRLYWWKVTYQREVEFVKDFLTKRILWMDENL